MQNPVEYVAAIHSRFLAKRIQPIRRSVVIEPHVADRLGLPVGDHPVYFVSEDDPQSVFYDPATNLFGCAWGPQLPDLRYVDLGFRSEDVLEMASA